ncbi:hypothetical protein VIGAN_03094400, partial [Vigna angularis var. angularis]
MGEILDIIQEKYSGTWPQEIEWGGAEEQRLLLAFLVLKWDLEICQMGTFNMQPTLRVWHLQMMREISNLTNTIQRHPS